jgi:hypothetical protein
MATVQKPILKFYPTEQIKILPIRRTLKGHKYAVTNYGRVIRYGKKPEEGVFIKPYTISAGYPGVFLQVGKKRMNALIHRLVAQTFLPKPSKDKIFVIHIDRDIANNYYTNLKWVSKAEHVDHAKGSKRWKDSYANSSRNKLNESRVRIIKRRIEAGKTSIKHLAKQFGVSDMQLYRIKWGENWGWVR